MIPGWIIYTTPASVAISESPPQGKRSGLLDTDPGSNNPDHRAINQYKDTK
jgi:hypothetical protein